jgi:hypothetical protein
MTGAFRISCGEQPRQPLRLPPTQAAISQRQRRDCIPGSWSENISLPTSLQFARPRLCFQSSITLGGNGRVPAPVRRQASGHISSKQKSSLNRSFCEIWSGLRSARRVAAIIKSSIRVATSFLSLFITRFFLALAISISCLRQLGALGLVVSRQNLGISAPRRLFVRLSLIRKGAEENTRCKKLRCARDHENLLGV